MKILYYFLGGFAALLMLTLVVYLLYVEFLWAGVIFYFTALLFSSVLGFVELSQMFSEAAFKSVERNIYTWVFIVLNGLSGLIAAVVKGFDTEWGLRDGFVYGALLGLAGMGILRSSIVAIKVGDKEVPVGPAAFVDQLKELLGKRIDAFAGANLYPKVSELMKDINVVESRDKLVMTCLSMREKVDVNTQKKLFRDLEKIQREGGHMAAALVGMTLVRVSGMKALETAISVNREELRWGGGPELDKMRDLVKNSVPGTQDDLVKSSVPGTPEE